MDAECFISTIPVQYKVLQYCHETKLVLPFSYLWCYSHDKLSRVSQDLQRLNTGEGTKQLNGEISFSFLPKGGEGRGGEGKHYTLCIQCVKQNSQEGSQTRAKGGGICLTPPEKSQYYLLCSYVYIHVVLYQMKLLHPMELKASRVPMQLMTPVYLWVITQSVVCKYDKPIIILHACIPVGRIHIIIIHEKN